MFNSSYPVAHQIGRIALPLFVMVLSYNIGSYKGDRISLCNKIIKKLFLFGIAAIPAFAYFKINILPDKEILFALPWYGIFIFLFPLNILFNFICLLQLIKWTEKIKAQPHNLVYVMLGFVLFSFIGEYGVSSFFIGLGIYLVLNANQANRFLGALFLIVGFVFLTNFYSNSLWPIISIPLLYIASNLDFKARRVGLFFYAYYPSHITVIVLLTASMAD